VDGELIKWIFLRYMPNNSFLTSANAGFYNIARYLMLQVNIPAHHVSLKHRKYKRSLERQVPHSQVKHTVNDATVSNNINYIESMTIGTI